MQEEPGAENSESRRAWEIQAWELIETAQGRGSVGWGEPQRAHKRPSI